MRRKTNGTEYGEIVAKVADRRSVRGQNFYRLYEQANSNGQTDLIALLGKLATDLHSQGVRIDDKTQINLDVQYTEGKKGERIGRCDYCSRHLRRVNRPIYSYETADGKVGKGHIPGTGAYTGNVGQTAVGNECLEHIKTIATSLGDADFLSKFTPGGEDEISRENKKIVEEIQIPETLRKFLEAHGIDPDAVKQIPELFEIGPDLLAGNLDAVEFALDTSNKKNWYNWFRQRYNDETIQDPQVRTVVGKIENRIHRLTQEDAALLIAYRYQLKDEPVEGLVGGLKKDLLFLEEILDVEFEPASLYRGSDYQTEKSRTVREALDGTHITVAEAIGIKIKFPGIEKRRQDRNKEMIRKYFETNGEFKKAIDSLSVVFANDKEKISKRGKQADTSLPMESYRALKYLFMLASKGTDSLVEASVKRIPMVDSERVYRTVFIESRKKQLADKQTDELKQRGIMATSYVPVIDFPNVVEMREKILGSYVPENGGVDKIQGIGPTTIRKFRESQTELKTPEIEDAINFGILPFSLVSGRSSVFGVGEVVKDYVRTDDETRGKITDIIDLLDLGFEKTVLDYRGHTLKASEWLTGFDVNRIGEAKFIGPWQKRKVDSIHKSAVNKPNTKKFLEEKEKYREMVGRVKQHEQDVVYTDNYGQFSSRCIWTRKRENVGTGVSVFDLTEIERSLGLLDSAVLGSEIDFMDDLLKLGFKLGQEDLKTKRFDPKAILYLRQRYSELKRRESLDKKIAEADEYYFDQGRVVSPKAAYRGLVRQSVNLESSKIADVEREVDRITALRVATPIDMLDPESVNDYNSLRGRMEISGYSIHPDPFQRKNDANSAFSKKKGGIGFVWKPSKDWHIPDVDKRKVDWKLSDLLKRNAEAGTYGRIRIC